MRVHPGLFFLFVGITFAHDLSGQDRCAFDAYQKILEQKNPGRKSDQFEPWMREKIRSRKLLRQNGYRTAAPAYTIPVVVHVIHNGEPVGTGVNISNAQIQSQLDVLNADYTRQNSDASNTPAIFQPVAGNLDIEFVLAKQDPEGLPTNGIVRVKGTKSSWSVSDAFQFKSQSYWPAEDYLNIWVIKFSDNFLGFAQFPETNLPGVEPPYDALTDGVVIDYTAFGSVDGGSFNLDPKYNKGRTTTHEVGHFLGLVHIFGNESGCSTSDFVDDTPVQSSRTTVCATHPTNSCGHPKMFQNYLDYTDDACMNLFTLGQVDRMVTILDNSPRRNSLLTSPGAVEPVVHTIDLEARRILAPAPITCGQDIIPKVEIRNRGTTTLTSARVQFLVNSSVVESKDFTLDLDQFETVALSFAVVDLAEPSTSNISFQILQINGGADDDASNNMIATSTQVRSRIPIPLIEPFNTSPSAWQILNPDNGIGWQNVVAPKATSTNRAMTVDLYNYEAETARDQLMSPVIDFSGADSPVLKFDLSYARFPNNSTDSLKVLVLTGCSSDPALAVEVFSKGGPALATANDTSNPFVPGGESQWRSESIALTAFINQNVQIIFESTNGYGNNLYLDNVQVDSGEFNDLAIVAVLSPGPVLCVGQPSPLIQIQNLGNVLTNRVQVTVELNGQQASSKLFSNLGLVTGAAKDLSLDPLGLIDGENLIRISIVNPDVATDELPLNNEVTLSRILNTSVEGLPLRQNFEKGLEEWSVVSQGAQQRWEVTTVNGSNAVAYKAFTNTNVAEEGWIASPVMDFSKAVSSSLFFDTSYGFRATGSERLRILVSEDCGMTYDQVLFDKSGSLLANENSALAWLPLDETDWRTEYLSLNDFSGQNNVRLAFVVTNGNGNNLYLDNIEWYVGDDPNPPRIEDFFYIYLSETNPYDFKITFNLPEKETPRLVVYNLMGQVLIDSLLPETLNQTYTINLFGQSSGIYIARLQAGGQQGIAKLFIGR